MVSGPENPVGAPSAFNFPAFLWMQGGRLRCRSVGPHHQQERRGSKEAARTAARVPQPQPLPRECRAGTARGGSGALAA